MKVILPETRDRCPLVVLDTCSMDELALV